MTPASRLIECDRLDPRPARQAAADPWPDCVNIPLTELPRRTHELPPRDVPVRVLGPPTLAGQTLEWLTSQQRAAVPARPDDPVDPRPGIRRLWRPNALLAQVAPALPAGTALDLACGSGRDAVFLAALGWRVTAIDILPDALQRGRELAARYAPAAAPVRWLRHDLEADLPPVEPVDLLIVFRFLHRPLLRRVHALLRPGGTLLVETFTTLHRQRHGRPGRERFVLQPGELPGLLEGLDIEHYSEAWRGTAHTARVRARRPR